MEPRAVAKVVIRQAPGQLLVEVPSGAFVEVLREFLKTARLVGGDSTLADIIDVELLRPRELARQLIGRNDDEPRDLKLKPLSPR